MRPPVPWAEAPAPGRSPGAQEPAHDQVGAAFREPLLGDRLQWLRGRHPAVTAAEGDQAGGLASQDFGQHLLDQPVGLTGVRGNLDVQGAAGDPRVLLRAPAAGGEGGRPRRMDLLLAGDLLAGPQDRVDLNGDLDGRGRELSGQAPEGLEPAVLRP